VTGPPSLPVTSIVAIEPVMSSSICRGWGLLQEFGPQFPAGPEQTPLLGHVTVTSPLQEFVPPSPPPPPVGSHTGMDSTFAGHAPEDT